MRNVGFAVLLTVLVSGAAGAYRGPSTIVIRQDAPAASRVPADLGRLSRPIAVADMAQARAAASDALKMVLPMISAADFRSFGFEKAADVEGATLGAPIATVFIPQDKLSAYENGTDPASTLEDDGGLIFPVRAASKVVCGIFMDNAGGTWKMVGFGKSEKVQEITATRKAVAASAKVRPATLFAVEAPSLSVTFIGRISGGKLLLTPISDDPVLGLKANTESRAEDTFTRLAPLARDARAMGQ